jgi:VanZ family protein
MPSVGWFQISLRLAFIASVIIVISLSLLPAKQAPSLFNDKLEHLASYALLGALGGLAFPARRTTILLIVLLPALAIALEIAQRFAPGRSTDIADALVSGSGAWLALVPKLLLRK